MCACLHTQALIQPEVLAKFLCDGLRGHRNALQPRYTGGQFL